MYTCSVVDEHEVAVARLAWAVGAAAAEEPTVRRMVFGDGLAVVAVSRYENGSTAVLLRESAGDGATHSILGVVASEQLAGLFEDTGRRGHGRWRWRLSWLQLSHGVFGSQMKARWLECRW